MRIIFRSHDYIDQCKNVRIGQMLPVFYRAVFFHHATNAARFVPCVFFPFLFAFFSGLQWKLLENREIKMNQILSFASTVLQCKIEHVLSGVSQFMDRHSLSPLIKNIVILTYVNYCINESNAFFWVAQRNKKFVSFLENIFLKKDKKPYCNSRRN